ncbi:ABC transporter substrate-binding protein [Paenibacillus sp. HW567]|uniref:ABC transporter substrate-binding protein n=1 Tax=Paenibacillus sp. HW567 TaxID=1034769 RepID=UPI0003692D50|nr:ABC transporter substrate-binding protein [Paenibacillus sp. HW567]
MLVNTTAGRFGKILSSKALLLLMLMGLVVSACGNNNSATGSTAPAETGAASPAAPAAEPAMQIVKHAYGETEVPLHPKRIAVIGLEDVMLSLDVPLVYAYGFDGFYLYNELKEKNIQMSGQADLTLNLEAILAAQPDLIVLQKYYTDDKGYGELSKIAPTIAFTPDDWKSSIKVIGQALGLEDKAQEVIQASEDKIAAAKAEITSAVGSNKSVIYIRPSDKDLQVFFPSFMPLLYDKLGFRADASVAEFQKTAEDDWGINTSLEKLPDITADYVFAIYGGSISSQEDYEKEVAAQSEVEKLQVWKVMPAVKQKHFYKVSARTWMSSGPIAEGRIVDDVVAAVTGKQ